MGVLRMSVGSVERVAVLYREQTQTVVNSLANRVLVRARQFDQLGDAGALVMPRCVVNGSQCAYSTGIETCHEGEILRHARVHDQKIPKRDRDGRDDGDGKANGPNQCSQCERRHGDGALIRPRRGVRVAQDALDLWRWYEDHETKRRHDAGHT